MPSVELTLGTVSDIASAEGNDAYFQQAGDLIRLPPVYVFDTYSVTVNAGLVLDEGELPHTISGVTVTSSISDLFAYSTSASSFTLTTGSNTPFSDEWEFLVPKEPTESDPDDYEYVRVDIPNDLVVNNEKTWINMIQWVPPSESTIDVTHTVTVNGYETAIPANTFTETLTLSQGMYFKYPPYTNLVKDIASGDYP